MDVITYALAKKMGGSGESITYTLTADTENKTIVLTPSRGTAQVITVPYATDASTVNGHEVPELENGKIPANFLPSFVDNVDEYDNISLFPVVGESNRIYIDKSTNKTYRWSGTAYVEISESIALGETSSTAYRGDRGKIAYDHSQSAHAPSNAEANQNAFSNVKIDSDIINASAKTDTLEFIAGDNIILTPNVSNKKITVSQVPVRATASGDIASFSDGTGDPFLEVKVNIEPQQDLHGYDNPWVGGAGKNKFNGADVTTSTPSNWGIDWNESASTLTITHKTEYSTGTPTFPLNLAVGTYVVSFASQTKIASISLYTNGAYTDVLRNGTNFTVESGNNYEIRFIADEGTPNAITKFQIETGSTATSFEPYSNICPISGHTEADVTKCGKNLLPSINQTQIISDVLWTKNNDGSITLSGTASANSVYDLGRSEGLTIPPGTYFANETGSNYNVNIFEIIDGSASVIKGGGGVFTITKPTTIFERIIVSNGTTINTTIYPQLELGSTATAYEPYQGSTLSIPFHDSSDNPITVYGGTLNVTSGELRVLGADTTVTENDNIEIATNASGFLFYIIRKTQNSIENNHQICDKLTRVEGGSASILYTTDSGFAVYSNGTVYFKVSSELDSVESIKNYLSSNPLHIYYELATPQTYQLTPTQVSTLLGQNNIFADCGQIEVAYKTPFYSDLTTKNEVQVLINESITSALNASY